MTTENIENLYELSPMQRGMLFHTLYAPDSGVYIGQFVCRLEGRLDPQLFYEVWQRTVLRHPPLRTAFLWMDVDEPLQVVYRSVPSSWREENWHGLSESEQLNRLETLLANDRKQGFDLVQAPLMRLILLRLSDEACYFVCSHHHILLDGWSLVAVLQEVFSLYEALHCGREPVLEQRRLFQDYIAWLRRRRLEDAEVFWRSYLQGFMAPTPLPISDHGWSEDAGSLKADEGDSALRSDGLLGRPLQGGRPVRLRGFTFSTEETEALRLAARYHQLTLNTLFQGAWAILLSRYSGEQDVVFGATVAGRPLDLAGSEKMIGLFINTLPVRVQVAPHEELGIWLRQLQEQQLEARQYDYSPLVQVQGWSEVPRELSLFESLVVFENYPLDRTQDENNSIRITAVQTLEQTNYPLVLVVGLTGEQGLKVQLGYEIARFSVYTIERMLKQLRTILVEMMHHPMPYLGDITLLGQEEQQRLLNELNSTQAYDKSTELPFMAERVSKRNDASEAVTIMDLVRAQALQVPEKVALVCGDCSLTYGELERRSNQLAHHLRNLGVGDETCIGVCMGRSGELAITLLGILKAGGVYLPLDQGFPQACLAFMLSETQAPIVLTLATHEKLFDAMNVRTLCIDVERELSTPVCDDPPVIEIRPANAAYIIYTSGSTGTPKGVVVSHQALLHHARVVGSAYGLREQDRVLQFASTSFDVSLEELLPSWTHGASVVMWYETIAPSTREFSDFIDREALTVLNLPSTYWHEWVIDVAHTRMVLPANLRLVVIGSERALAVRLALWQRLVGERVALYNAYGLTETTITALLYAPDWISTPDESHAPVPVGRPLAGIQAYVLDERLQPVPPGMPGELYIGGICLGRGYLRNAALTAGRFLPNPFSTIPGARLYRTGDRARVITWASASTSLPEPIIELLGRSDAQVKVRGFRIEPAEIEARLLQHPSVREALVLAREDTPGETVLVAYIVASEQQPMLVTRLRQYLQDTLPSYMIPAFFVPLKALPRTSGGKVNIRSLPSPQQKLTQSDIYIPPRTPVEEILAVIWCEVLRLERVGRADHFFKLGGHSLQATQIVARLREALRVELPVRAVYDAPTLAALATRIEQQRRQASGQRIPSIPRTERKAPLPLSFAQQRFWFLVQFEPGNPFYTMPGMLYLRGSLNVASLERSLQALVQRHETLRTTFALHEGQPVQIIAPTLPLPLPVIQLAGTNSMSRHEETINDLAREEARQPFDLQRGPLVRTTLFRLNEQEHVLLLTLHHIVADGWSMEILLQELSAFYTAHLSGQPVILPSLPIQYADYATWQSSWLQGDILEQQLAYWRHQLADAPLMLALPTDRPRPALQTYNGAIYMFHLPLSLTQRFHTLSREEGVTPFMALLAAFQVLLFRYSNQSDIVVGTPTSGRVQRETEGVVGLFLNMLALRTEVNADLTYRELLQRVHDITLDAYMHQDVPFEKLVEELRPERSLSHPPFFQVMLVVQNVPVESIELPGLSLETFGVESNTAKFDLTLGVRETSSGLRCFAEYNTDLFDEATIARMAGHFQTLLENCTANPQVRLADLPLLTPAERRQVLLEWNADRQVLSAHCMHHIVEGWSHTTPDAIALVNEAEQLTYAGLNQRANRLAHYLQSLGIGPDDRVGLLLNRSLDQIVSILGILKAGGAYVHLDPAYPQERLAFMLEDASISVLLAHEELRPCLPDYPDLLEVYLDREWQRIERYAASNPASHVQPDSLAYIMYTSGSTGRPKGVMVTHQGLCNLAQAQAARRGEQADTRAIQWLSLSFDASLTEIATTFQAGATLCLGDREQLQHSEDLLAFLEREAITTLTIPPPALALLPQTDLPHVRKIIVGAEPFSGDLVARWSQGRRFFNEYGPTETTVSATVAECHSNEPPSIGRPLANVQVYLLDPYLQPVPAG
ncbi:MAG TPA: amino acid adenylation domain-containing protein, partial [Ktedonobacteraceae bacterium]|nr:amino acid adenylation domain-containing protein [Ktedonobacteraceae bacterium]